MGLGMDDVKGGALRRKRRRRFARVGWTDSDEL